MTTKRILGYSLAGLILVACGIIGVARFKDYKGDQHRAEYGYLLDTAERLFSEGAAPAEYQEALGSPEKVSATDRGTRLWYYASPQRGRYSYSILLELDSGEEQVLDYSHIVDN